MNTNSKTINYLFSNVRTLSIVLLKGVSVLLLFLNFLCWFYWKRIFESHFTMQNHFHIFLPAALIEAFVNECNSVNFLDNDWKTKIGMRSLPEYNCASSQLKGQLRPFQIPSLFATPLEIYTNTVIY